MKKNLLILCLMALSPAVLSAQGTKNDLENDFGARISVAVDKKIVKGFHANVEGEARLSDNLTNFGRYQAGAGLSYKVSQLVKVGGGYIFIEDKNSSGIWNPRHRAYGDLTFTLRDGFWRFSLKERLQYTHREVNNKFQSTPNSLTLKSRFKVAYKSPASRWIPYSYIEFRNVFNDPAENATWNDASSKYDSYEFLGYKDAYFNRVRGVIGVEYNFDQWNAIEVFGMVSYSYDKDIDTNAEGTKLKSLTYDRKLMSWIGIGYTFSF
jgi:hypothetical protein